MNDLKLDQLLLNAKQLDAVVQRRCLLNEWETADCSLREFAQRKGISMSSLCRYRRNANKPVFEQIDRRLRCQPTGSKVCNEVLLYMLGYKALHPKSKICRAYEDLQVVAKKQGWKVPHYGTLCRVLKQLPADLRLLMESDGKELFNKLGIVLAHAASHPNGLVGIDATEIPIWVRDMVTGELFKPWLMALIDDHSRVILSALVCRSVPDAGIALKALRQGILPKNSDHLPFYGLMAKLHSDRGSIFTSEDFQDALIRLGVDPELSPRDCPGNNGKIERWFRTFKDGLIKNLDGYSGQSRALEKASHHAIPYPLLQKLVDQFVVKYHLTVHSELEMTPWEAWHQKLESAHGLYVDAAQVIRACRVRREVLVARDGIELFPGVHYHSPALAGLVGETLTVRVSPDGPADTIEAYHRGVLIDELRRVEGDQSLARDIAQGRLDRIKELQGLRKDIRVAAETLLPRTAELLPDSLPEKPSEPEGSTENAPPPVGEVPKLETEEG